MSKAENVKLFRFTDEETNLSLDEILGDCKHFSEQDVININSVSVGETVNLRNGWQLQRIK